MRLSLLLGLPVVLFACGRGPDPAPKPGRLKAGLVTLPFDAPIGISMGGYSRKKNSTDQGSRFAQNFDSTTGVHTAPTVRALALDDGLKQVVLVRLHTALVTETLQLRAQQHLGLPNVSLIIAATHTHAGPARIFRPAPIDGDTFDVTAVAMDVYDPELEDRMAASIADAAKAAIAAEVPVAMGHGEADAPALNNDRRCENDDLYGPDYRDPTIRVIRLDTVDALGNPVAPLAGILNYAVHGTILDPGNTLMSSDAPGALESASSDLLGVPLLYLQGTAGDVSPNTGDYSAIQAIERYGLLGAPLVKQAFDKAAPTKAPEHATLELTTRGISTLPRDVGYQTGEFAAFGAIDCGLDDGDCHEVLTPKTMICLPLANTHVVQEPISALRLEDVLMVVLPGEPLTAIGARIRETTKDMAGISTTLIVGYAQDHSGYLLEEPDYLRGGYEPSVSPWGWRFGDYLVAQAKLMLGSLGTAQPAFTALPGFDITTHRIVENSAAVPGVISSPIDLERLGTATFSFNGGDPSLGVPKVSLEVEHSGAFVAAPPDVVILREASTPSFDEDADAGTRAHVYTAQWETVPTTVLGRYRLVADGLVQTNGTTNTYHLESAAFAVAISTAAGAKSSAALSTDGTLSVQIRFAPNPTLWGAKDDPIGNFRIRDLDSTAEQGALARGGQATAQLKAPDGTHPSATLTWSESGLALTTSVGMQVGHWSVDIAANAFTDAAGNTNAQPVHIEMNL